MRSMKLNTCHSMEQRSFIKYEWSHHSTSVRRVYKTIACSQIVFVFVLLNRVRTIQLLCDIYLYSADADIFIHCSGAIRRSVTSFIDMIRGRAHHHISNSSVGNFLIDLTMLAANACVHVPRSFSFDGKTTLQLFYLLDLIFFWWTPFVRWWAQCEW